VSDEPDDDTVVDDRSGYRSYEVYQRERVGESTHLLTPKELLGDEMLTDPYRLLTILREEYPCYRDWKGNRFWITRYDDVTSVFVDDANYETRPKRWFLGRPDLGPDRWDDVTVQEWFADGVDRAVEACTERILADLRTEAADGGSIDLATGFAARLPVELWGELLGLGVDELAGFARRWWRLQQGTGWDERGRVDALVAHDELVAFFADRDRPVGMTAEELVATLLEADHETLHGGLANLWFLLLTHPDQLDAVRSTPRLMTFAWLETLRHSPPTHSASRFARHEVERFGRLLPEGALLQLSAAAANRDPRAFGDPDSFLVERGDLCQREPRGQYRADGLPSGIAFGLGKPSRHPAVPKERPRSRYALTRDTAVTASTMLLDAFPDLRVAAVTTPHLRALRLGDMHTCWHLPATLGVTPGVTPGV
jgi:cytochrome P450